MSFHFGRFMRRLETLLSGKARRRCAKQGKRRLEIERLEDRFMPATNITVISGAAGAGTLDHFVDATHGTITTADDPGDPAATLSVGALEGVGAGVAISIAADAAIHFNDISTLALQTGTGFNAGFSTASGAIDFANLANTLSTGGGSLTFSAGTNLTVANVLNTSTGGGGVSLTAGTTGPAGAGGNLQFGNISTNSGNLSFSATAGTTNSGTITQTGVTSANGSAINAAATGNIAINALIGTTVNLTSNQGSVTSTGSAAVQASAQLTVSAARGITLNTLAVFLQAGNSTSGNISITQAAAPAQTLTVVGSGVVNSASTGTVTLDNLGASITINNGVNVQSNNGGVTLAATDLQLNGQVNSGTARTTLANAVAGTPIDVGSNTPGTIGLTQTELNNVTAGVLQIGSATAGSINISAAITNPAGWNTLALVNGATVTEAAAGSLTLPNLRVSSTGPVTLTSANNVGVVAADTTNGFSFSNGTNLLTDGVVDGDTGIVTSGSDIHLIADSMDLAQQVTTGSKTAGVVNLEPFTNSRTIDLGTNSAGNLGLTDTELNEVTANVLRMGSSNFAGDIMVSAAINPTHISALSLITTGSGTITEIGTDLTVDSGNGGLAIQANTPTTVSLPDVAKFAAAITGAGNSIQYTTLNAFAVSTVDGVAGITTSIGNNEGVGLQLLGSGDITQDSGASIVSDNLDVSGGAGAVTLTDSGNDVDKFGATAGGNISYTDADAVTIGFGGGTVPAIPVVGVNSSNGSVSVNTVAGNLTVSIGGVFSATTISLTAGGLDSVLSNQSTIFTGTAVTLTADRMDLASGTIQTLTGGSNVVTLQGYSSGRTVDLGGTGDPTGTLQISQAELNTITTDIVRVGSAAAGDLTVTATISNGANWSALALISGAGISQNSGQGLKVTNLALQAGGTGNVLLVDPTNAITQLAGSTNDGSLNFFNSQGMTVSTVDTLTGITITGGTVRITISNGGQLTVSQAITGNNNDIVLIADRMTLSAAVNAGNQRVSLFPDSDRAITVGTTVAGTLSLLQTDLNEVTAAALLIGSVADTGGLTVTAAITDVGTGWNTLVLEQGNGTISENASGTLTVTNLGASTSGSGNITLANAGNQVTNLAFAAGGNVQFANTGALTINSVAGLATSSSGGTQTLSAASPFTFAVNDVSGGTIGVTTTETASEDTSGANMPLPPPDDDITVNSNVTIESTGGDVDLTSGDSIIEQPGAVLKADTGSVNTNVGVGDNDNDALFEAPAILTIDSTGTITVDQNVTVTDGTGGPVIGVGQSITSGTAVVEDINTSSYLPTSVTILNQSSNNLELHKITTVGVGDVSVTDTNSTDSIMTFLGPLDTTAASSGKVSIAAVGQLVVSPNISVNFSAASVNSIDPNTIDVGVNSGLVAGDAVVYNDNGGSAIGGLTNGDTYYVINPAGGTIQLATTPGGAAIALSPGLGIQKLAAAGSISSDGSVSLTDAGNSSGDGIIEAASISAAGSGSTVTLGANRDVSLIGTATLSTTNATGGAISITSAETLGSFTTNGTGAVTMGSHTSVNTSANNSTITVDAGTTAGNGGNITLAALNANTGAVNVQTFAGSILDGNGSGTNNVTGGAINLSATGPSGINLDLITTTPATAGVTATSTGGNITLRSTQQLQVDNINAGSTNDVSLTVNNANTAVSSITSLHPNNNVADVTGHTVTLTANGPTTGNTGQIGFFSGSAQFFEVAATTLNASTNNSRAWIALIGGAAIGSVNVGSNTIFLKTVNGDLTSTHSGSVPDVTAASVNLSSPGTSGSFGTGNNFLLLQTSTLKASVTGTGSIDVTNVIAGGDLSVSSATTASGEINLLVESGNLTTTATTGTDINAPGNTVTLAALAIISGTSAGVTDVAATGLAASASGIGSTANPLKTVLTNLAFDNTGNAVDVTNTGALTIAGVSGLTTSSNTGTTTTLSATSAITFAASCTSAGDLSVTTTETASEGPPTNNPLPSPDDNITVNSFVTVESTGGNVTLTSADALTSGTNARVIAAQGTVTQNFGVGDIDNDALTATEQALQTLATADNFFVDSRGLFENLFGNEKWLRGNANSFGNPWYFVLPNGDLYEWNGSGLHGNLLISLGPNAWQNPELIVGASSLAAANPSQVQTADQTQAFFRSSADDYYLNDFGSQEKWIEGLISAKLPADQNNPWYFILPDGTVHEWDGTSGKLTGPAVAGLTADVNLYKDPSLLTDAYQNAAVNSGGWATQRHFYFDSSEGLVRNLWENFFGADEKWFRGDTNQFNNPWYFVLPGGNLVEWDGTRNATGHVLANLGPDAWNNVDRVVNDFNPVLTQADQQNLVNLDMQYGVFRASNDKNFYFNLLGQQDKWLAGVTNTFGNNWYILLPNNTLVAWNGTGSTPPGHVLATNLPPEVYADPLLLADAFADGSTLDTEGRTNPFVINGGGPGDHL